MKTAILTGASSGMGLEFARQLKDVFPEIECFLLLFLRRWEKRRRRRCRLNVVNGIIQKCDEFALDIRC